MDGTGSDEGSPYLPFYDDAIPHGQAVIFKGWKIKKKSKLHVGSPIFSYEISTDANNGVEVNWKIFRSNFAGIVTETMPIKLNDALKNGDAVIKLQRCKHPFIMKDMCGDCGENLRVKDGMPGERLFSAPARVSMIHSIPELQVTVDEAHKLGTADEENVIKLRKLVLLVDLDQTLVHTTNEEVASDLKEVHHFQLYGANSPWYHVRLRPNTLHFLRNMRALYEMHICTFGSRLYAHKIAEILDSDGSIFGKRILSRDECFSPLLKTANLKALFPCGDRLVCIIDDREDVWDFASNVIRVKPYRFFSHTGDINAPPGFAKPDPTTQDTSPDFHPSDQFSQHLSDSLDVNARISDDSTVSSSVESTVVKIEDEDDYLYHLEEILRKIHTAFYQLYDQSPENERPPDMHSVIPYVKSKVLKNVNIVFSGVIPMAENLSNAAICKLAQSLGANVQESILSLRPLAKPILLPGGKKLAKHLSASEDLPRATTHLVASKFGTVKVKQAEKLNGQVKVVSPDWLWSCAERWERVDERLFPLAAIETKDSKREAEKNLLPNSAESSTDFGTSQLFSSSDFKAVDQPFHSISSKRKYEGDHEENQTVSKVDPTAQDNKSAELCEKSFTDNNSPQEKNTSSDHVTSSSCSEEGTDDDEMAAALEKEFY